MATVAQLIETLQRIEDKEQLCLGEIWIAEDFTYEDEEGNEIPFTPEDVEEISEYRTISKSLGYLYDEILDLLIENREN